MKKQAKYILSILCLTVAVSSCESLVDGINDNPNQLTLNEIDAGLFMNGAELGNIDIQLGAYSRMAAYYSGQLIGYEQVERFRYQYEVVNTDFNWDGYQSVVNPARLIRSRTEGNNLYQGISKVLEAHLIGTYATLFGDIPYSEAVSDIIDPVFDKQSAILAQLQLVLDSAIEDLNKVEASDVVAEDYIYNGDGEKWLEAAWTLKARLYMISKSYEEAFAAAQNGISSHANSMMFNPLDVTGQNTTKNKYYIVLQNGPNLGTGDSYLMKLLDTESGISRNNEKTNEEARMMYYEIDRTSATVNMGIAHELEPQPLITFGENTLILAEAGARTQGMETGLQYLNMHRSYLNSGSFLNSNFDQYTLSYLPYVATDFQAGGIENRDGISPERALLREIIEERYVTGFTTFMPFDDARRLKKDDTDVLVPFPLNTATAAQNIERFLTPETEMTTNSNAPEDPGFYQPTQVNQ
ncbi:SusD/RagB family nutrient-binding outer membrane lipoprotein [Algoriphagus sp. Y33]|uniref:SusD/RagB family nutrient-binding outer membrane lipoprotein n=1 Tax=Algoriphagus sp. Y33 TaxID=2772483 RepID=UPI00177C93B5|nr:SusD/RagB family nutrient-binding outer membrane lipoprotein [Algoriphagus sp. Y33]